MKFPIGFASESKKAEEMCAPKSSAAALKADKSLVEVCFPSANRTLSYYNDRFSLSKGDLVFVDGKFAGVQGFVVNVCHSFKIKPSDYKRVIVVADTSAEGEFCNYNSHFVTLDRGVIPFDKVLKWYAAPSEDEEEYVRGDGEGESFDIPGELPFSKNAVERGLDYLEQNRVLYLELDGTKCRAIVRGSEIYTVEFDFDRGHISNMVCDCYCPELCKHEFAAVMQLGWLLDRLEEENFSDRVRYFAAISKQELFSIVVDKGQCRRVSLGR